MPKREIDKFVASKEQWISTHLVLSERRSEERAAFTLDYGDTALLRGSPYPIPAKDSRHAGFDGECFFIPPGLPPEDIKRAVIQTYKICAKSILTGKTAEYAKRMGVTPAAVKINSAKTRWGSCSAKNSLNFSWRLIMAEDSVIDYVVVHELAHIREHNHSKRFWAVVEDVLPDYRRRKQRLKALQEKLSREDWG
jgi:predicted metal-dependent hydrolase